MFGCKVLRRRDGVHFQQKKSQALNDDTIMKNSKLVEDLFLGLFSSFEVKSNTHV
jgi:hypothetical protein